MSLAGSSVIGSVEEISSTIEVESTIARGGGGGVGIGFGLR